MTQANEQQLERKKTIKKELSKVFWIYQLDCELSNFCERLQSLVFRASMIPAIEELYVDDEEQQREALKCHLNFFNIEGIVGASVQGIVIAMGEKKSDGVAIFSTAITSIKTGLMGPLAGTGDSITWAALMPLTVSISILMAKGGNVIGSIGPLALYMTITLYVSRVLVDKSYTLGRNSILSSLKDGRIKQVIHSVNASGMMMMGVSSASYVKIASPMTFKVTSGVTIALQGTLDQIMKGLFPLTTVMATYFFMVKKGSRYGIIIGTIVLVSLVTSFFGLL